RARPRRGGGGARARDVRWRSAQLLRPPPRGVRGRLEGRLAPGARLRRVRLGSRAEAPYTRKAMRSVATIGRWSTRHPWLAIVAWPSFVLLAVVAVSCAGTAPRPRAAAG